MAVSGKNPVAAVGEHYHFGALRGEVVISLNTGKRDTDTVLHYQAYITLAVTEEYHGIGAVLFDM